MNCRYSERLANVQRHRHDTVSLSITLPQGAARRSPLVSHPVFRPIPCKCWGPSYYKEGREELSRLLCYYCHSGGYSRTLVMTCESLPGVPEDGTRTPRMGAWEGVN